MHILLAIRIWMMMQSGHWRCIVRILTSTDLERFIVQSLCGFYSQTLVMSQSQWKSKLELAPCLWTLEERWEISFQLSWATVVKPINKTKRMSVVFDLELFVILRAVRFWRQCVTNCAIVIYTDNDAVRDCLISRNTPSSKTQDLFWTCTWRSNLKQPSTLGCPGFLSESNIADDPPRGDCKYVTSLGCVRTEIDGDLVWNDVQDFHTKGGATTSRVKKMCEWSTARA